MFFDAFRTLDSSADFEDVADVVHEAKHAHREEADCIKSKERSNDVLASVNVFEQTENAVDANDKFKECHPRELLCVVALDLLLCATALRGADKTALGAKNCGEHSAGVANGNANAKCHQDGEREQANLPTGVAGATLGDKVKNGRCDGCSKDKCESDGVCPSGEVSDRFKECKQRPCAECGKQHAGVNRVVRCVEDGADLHAERNLGAQNLRQNLDGRLNGAFCPTELLCLESVDVVREFCRNNHVEHKLHLPTGKLRAVRKVHVFGERVAFPAATAVNSVLAPNACGTVEVHEELAPATCGLFHNKVTVDTDRLCERKTGFGAVQVAPAALDKSDLRVHNEVRDSLEEEIFFWNEVGIEDGEEFTLRDSHAFLEGAGLEVLAVRAVDQLDIITTCGEFSDFLLGDFVAFVRRVIQDLDFMLVFGVVDGADSLEETFNAVGFVKNRELCRDLWQVGHGVFAVVLQDGLAVRKSRFAAILEEQIDAVVAAKPVNHQSHACDNVDDEHCV